MVTLHCSDGPLAPKVTLGESWLRVSTTPKSGGGLPSNSHTVLLHGPRKQSGQADLDLVATEKRKCYIHTGWAAWEEGLDSRYRMKTVLLISHQNHSVVPHSTVRTMLYKAELKRVEVLLEEKNGENMVIIPKCPQVCHRENRVPYSLYLVLLLMAELESVSES